jgi:hypothetical protein
MIQQGVATAADIDAVVTGSVGLRWAVICPFQALHLGGGPGGIHQWFAHIGAGLVAGWTQLALRRSRRRRQRDYPLLRRVVFIASAAAVTRAQLRIAHDMLDTMGIEAFADRARRELLAAGGTARKRTVETCGQLTAQEAQIARLARDGLSNPEIGVRLFIGTRTVKYPLRKVFAKLYRVKIYDDAGRK